jgi:tRNA nucleotidyltransferase (CCA-adding enzyme)
VPARSASQLIDRLAALPAGEQLLEALRAADGVFLVGGAVRDLVRGRAPVDLDLVTDRDLAELVAELGDGVPARVHDRFGTATLVLDGRRYDLARARRERYPRPGALPEVQPASLAEDLARRDFTVNAIALGLGGTRRGELAAVDGALDDLESGTLRVLHEASFRDDPTRLLRLARYGARLGYAPDAETEALAAEAIAGGALETVSGSRLGAELRLLAVEDDPAPALQALGRHGLGAALLPGFAPPSREALTCGLAILGDAGDPGALVLAAALVGAPAAELSARLDALAFPAPQRRAILAATGGSRALSARLGAAGRPSEILEAAAGAPPEAVALAAALGSPAAGEAARRWLGELRHAGLEIDGNDLISAGIPVGPLIGEGLRAALAARLDGRAADREAQLTEALRVARGA